MMRQAVRPFLLIGALAGCAQLGVPDGRSASPAGVGGASALPAETPAPVATGSASSPAALDTVTDDQKTAARAAAAAAPAGGVLGRETVALGDPADPGLWVKTGLVAEAGTGTVRSSGGEAIAVALRPLDTDGGAQISLSALQALGLPLTGLHPVTVARPPTSPG
jgi:hypothetical protein